MGKRGPKLKNGKRKPTVKGYIRRYYAETRSYRMEHDVVWEKAHGIIPKGHVVHHKNDIKTDNRLENLELVTLLHPKRIHSGCFLDDQNRWYKPCCKCGEFKEVEGDYYKRVDGISPWCKSCCKANATENYRKRKAAYSK
jgi:hypothetical protein